MCVFMLGSGITTMGKGSGDQAVHPWIPAAVQKDNSSPDAWDGCPDASWLGPAAGLAVPSQPSGSWKLCWEGEAVAGLG